MVSDRTGFTLLEVLIATALLGLVMGAGYFMFNTGQSMAVRGIASCEVLSAANQFEQRLAHDLTQMIVTTSTSDVVVGLSGTYLSFMVPRMDRYQSVFPSRPGAASTTESWTVYAEEVRYHLVRSEIAGFHPMRNGHVMGAVNLKRWQFKLVSESSESLSPSKGSVVVMEPKLPDDLFLELGIAPEPAPSSGDGTVPYLLLEYTLIDVELRTTQPRAVLFDLENSRIKGTYGSLYAVSPELTKMPRRRKLPLDVAQVFDPRWESIKSQEDDR